MILLRQLFRDRIELPLKSQAVPVGRTRYGDERVSLLVLYPHPELFVGAEEGDDRADTEEDEPDIDHPYAGVLRHLKAGVPCAPVASIRDDIVFRHHGLALVHLQYYGFIQQ